jgi:tetratricopeptide (TPR) repeat protein
LRGVLLSSKSVTIARMRKAPKIRTVFLSLAVLVVLGIAAYNYPPINYRLGWRVELAKTRILNIIDPAGPLPTALPLPTETPGPSATFTHTPSPTPTITPTQPGPTSTPIPSSTPLPDAVALTAPGWEKQDLNNCGPATLSMYMRYYGWPGDQFTVSELLKPRREDRNVNVEELVYYVRTRAGWLNAEFRVGGDIELLKRFLASGIPVVVEAGMQLDEPVPYTQDYWAAHYLLLTAYDDNRQQFIAHDSFVGPDQEISYAELDENWHPFNRVYILVYLPHQEELVQSILGPHWDVAHNRQHALDISTAQTEADPDDGFAWFNVGTNLVYFERYYEAAQAYDTARSLELPQRMLRYQFGPFFAYFHTFRNEELLALTEHALKVTRNSEEALLWRGWAHFRMGNRAAALADFNAALEANPNHLDAQYAINFLKDNP